MAAIIILLKSNNAWLRGFIRIVYTMPIRLLNN